MQNSQRFHFAIIASLLVHGAILAARLPALRLQAPKPLEVDLRPLQPPPPVEEKPVEAEPVLKNDFAETREKAKAPPKPPQPAPVKAKSKPQRAAPKHEQAMLKKLSKHIFYPDAAVNAGIEGTVVLMLRLDAQGRLLAVSIAASSGHAELDDAALKAARATGSFGAIGKSELLLPVDFRLQ